MCILARVRMLNSEFHGMHDRRYSTTSEDGRTTRLPYGQIYSQISAAALVDGEDDGSDDSIATPPPSTNTTPTRLVPKLAQCSPWALSCGCWCSDSAELSALAPLPRRHSNFLASISRPRHVHRHGHRHPSFKWQAGRGASRNGRRR